MPQKYYYKAEISHAGLNKYQVVQAETRYELDQKISAIQNQWNEQWARETQRRNKEAERLSKIKNVEESIVYANEMTKNAERIQNELDSMLTSSLLPKSVTPEQLKDFSDYPVSKPEKPKLAPIPAKPQNSDMKYNPKMPFFTRISKKKAKAFREIYISLFAQDLVAWESAKANVEGKNETIIKQYEYQLERWNNQNTEFKKIQAEKNANVDMVFRQYRTGDALSVEQYFTWALERIDIPLENYDRCVDIEYDAENKRAVIDMIFPTMEVMPVLKEVSYIKSRNELKKTNYPESYMKKKYDNVIYQLVLQTLNYLFALGNKYDLFNSLVLNGKIDTIDKATGRNIEPYILSVTITRTEFESINLPAVDPKAWYRSVKGVSAVTFANVTPIAPLQTISRNDDRFIQGYNVADQLDDRVNLAMIDWQDFENLIRDIFEKEFSTNGGEVKITQASRDGGVDAIAYDADQIKGGKIVIQAKRYTNVVGVSAVRDLYGTVVNEGANKGILVTTSNYGSDAYKFAKDKPLTLLNGANLLYLLEKHGYKARIDIQEAKKSME